MGKFPAIFIVAAFMWIFYEKANFGQQLKAVGGNEKVLRLVGINVTSFKIKVFAAAGVMVGIASCVNLARAGAATPQAGLMIELDAIAAVALGGTPLTGGYGSVVKTIIGALTLTVVRNGLTIAGVPPSWSQVALGALLIAAIAISLNRSKVDVVKQVCTSFADFCKPSSDRNACPCSSFTVIGPSVGAAAGHAYGGQEFYRAMPWFDVFEHVIDKLLCQFPRAVDMIYGDIKIIRAGISLKGVATLVCGNDDNYSFSNFPSIERSNCTTYE